MANTATISKHSIVHVIDRLHTGGAERVVVTLANIFYKHGHKVKVVTIAEAGPLAAQLLPGVEHVNLGRTFKFDPFIMRKLIKQVKGFDVVHVHSFFNLRYLWLAKILFGLKQQVFYHEHFGFRANMQPTAWQKYILPKTIFIATTAQINAWAVKGLLMPQNRVFTLPNIVLREDRKTGRPEVSKTELQQDVKTELQQDGKTELQQDRKTGSQQDRKTGRKQDGETGSQQSGYAEGKDDGKRESQQDGETAKQLVLVSNLRTEKNIEFAITLLQYLNRAGAGYGLTIIGKLSNIEYQSKLLQLAQETNTVDNITWVHNADNVQQLLGAFDLGLHTSPSESGPLAVIEYLAQGLPFVAYDTGEVITTIKPSLAHCIAYSFNPVEWEEKIQYLEAVQQTVVQQQLQAVFEKHFSAEVYYQQCLEIYQTPSAP